MALTLTTSGSLNTTVDNYAFSILSNTSSVQLGAVSLKLIVPGGCTIKNVNAGTSSVDSLVFLQQDGNLNIGMYTLSNWVVNTNDVILSITASGMSTGSFTLNTDEDWYCEIASSSAEPFTDFAIKMPSLASPYASVSTTLEAVSILSGVNPSITAVGAPNSSVFGSGSRTLGTASIAEGINTLASGLASHAAGINTTASGQAAFSMGIETDADGMASFAAGSGSWAKGTATVAMGIGTIASASGQTVVGHYNLGLGDFNNLFVVGGGSDAATNSRKNLFRVYGGSGASTVGVEINTSETQYISSFDGFNVYGKTRFFGGVTGSAIDFNAIGLDTKTNQDPILGTITTGSFTSNFYRSQNVLGGGPLDFENVLKASVRLDHRGINFSLSEQTTAPGSTFLWTNSSNRLFYSSSAVILNDGNTLGSAMLIGTNDTNNLELETGGTTRVFISSSGNVGIGTSSPTERLHVDGNLLVTGRITAEEFHTEFVSASIIYQSGSTQFGNSLDDTHIFTGSLKVNGSITGSLFGTASWATNALTASNITPSITNNTDNRVLTATGGGTINGESNLTFDGSVLTVTGRANISTSITSSTATVGFGLASALNAGQTTIKGSGADTAGALTIQNSGGTAVFTVLNGGTTGVGENNPSARLHVKGSGATSATTALRVENSSAAARLTILDNGTSAFNTNHLYVSSSGCVGIGTSNPLSFLHISASSGNEFLRITSGSQNILNVRSGSAVFFAGTGVAPTAGFDLDVQGTGTANGGSVRFAANSTIWQFGSVSSVNRNGTGATNMFNVLMTGTAVSSIQNPMSVTFNANQNSTSGSGYIVLRLNATHATTAGTGSKLLQSWEFGGVRQSIMDISGSLGIGTGSAPPARLFISGANAQSLLQIASPASSSILSVSGSGYIGIGVASPASRLHISGASANGLFEIDSPAVNNIIYVSGSGNIGIGTNLPSAELHISGASIDSLLRVGSPTQENILFITGSNRVGIGTGTPRALFEVNNKIIAEAAGNVGIQTTPSEWIHLSSDPASSKYLRIDAVQNGNPPPDYNPNGGYQVNRLWGSTLDDNALGTPDYWMEIKLNGTIVLIPCYLPA